MMSGGLRPERRAVRPEQGYPLRLVVPGWEGINNVKWLRRIKVVDKPYMGMMEATKYPSLRQDGKSRWFESEMGPKSVITRPSGGHRLPGRDFTRSLAWRGRGGEHQEGRSFNRRWTDMEDAQIQGPVPRKAHTRFRIGWNWDGKETVLQSRCTDERRSSADGSRDGKIWGVDLDYLSNNNDIIGHFNAIQPWKVTQDGSVQNAMFV